VKGRVCCDKNWWFTGWRGSQLRQGTRGEGGFPDQVPQGIGATIIVRRGQSKEIAQQLQWKDPADLFGFGTLFISNPDLVERFKNTWPLNPPDPKTFYGWNARGYTDYPAFQEEYVARNESSRQRRSTTASLSSWRCVRPRLDCERPAYSSPRKGSCGRCLLKGEGSRNLGTGSAVGCLVQNLAFTVAQGSAFAHASLAS
jgi:hypothetical protein